MLKKCIKCVWNTGQNKFWLNNSNVEFRIFLSFQVVFYPRIYQKLSFKLPNNFDEAGISNNQNFCHWSSLTAPNHFDEAYKIIWRRRKVGRNCDRLELCSYNRLSPWGGGAFVNKTRRRSRNFWFRIYCSLSTKSFQF